MNFFDFSPWIDSGWDWVVLMACGMLIGMSKTGFQGSAALAVPVLAVTFGAKASTGIILPILCAADLIAVLYYHRSAEWKYILRLLPAALGGFLVAIAVVEIAPAGLFRYLMALCIFLAMATMVWNKRRGDVEKIANSWWFGPVFGLLSGFTSMIGNAAGPVISVYLLSLRLPKYAFVGTGAWFFLTLNYLKIPVQVYFWGNITLSSAALSLATLPAILIGAMIGTRFVYRISDPHYRTFIIVITLLSTLLLIV